MPTLQLASLTNGNPLVKIKPHALWALSFLDISQEAFIKPDARCLCYIGVESVVILCQRFGEAVYVAFWVEDGPRNTTCDTSAGFGYQ